MSGTTDNISSFATVGEVFEDGVSLIFDGQEEATEKHYKVNTSVIFSAGDRVKILADSGTYVVEYVVGVPKKNDESTGTGGASLPAGGATGQSLLKNSDEDNDLVWGEPAGLIPTGGSTSHVLKKASAKDRDVEWGTVDGAVPIGGSSGQFLKKASSGNYDVEWATLTGLLPTGGTSGQVLKKTSAANYAASWGSVDGMLPTGGTKGQALIKSSATNYAAAWGDVSVNSIINQYNTGDNYVIQFKTDASGNFHIRCGPYGTWKQITVG